MKSARALFAGLRRRARVGIAVEAIAVLAAAATGFVAISYALDRTLHLEVPYRAAILLAFAIYAARLLWRRGIAPMRVELSDDEFALAVERRDPALHTALISAVQFDRSLDAGRTHGESVALMRRVVADVESRVSGLGLHRALDGRRVLRYVGLFVLALAAVSSWFGLAPTESRLWARRNLALADEPWPRETWLRFLDVDPAVPLRLAEREDLTLRVRADGVVPETVELECRFASGETSTRPMDRTGENVFSARLEAVLEDLELVARGNDGETDVLRVSIVPRPRITALGVTVTPPAYLGREPQQIDALAGEIRVVRGSRLAIAATSSKPLRQAALRVGQDRRQPMTLDAERTSATAELELDATTEVGVEVLDDDDLGPRMPPQLIVRVVEDLPPVLDFVTQGVGRMITSNARIPGVLRITDDHGVATVAGLYRYIEVDVGDGAPAEEPGDFVAAPIDWGDDLELGAAEQELGLVFDLQPLATDVDPDAVTNPIHPGQLLSLRFDATDQRAPEPGQGSSEVLNLRVVTRETLLQDLRRRQLEQRRELELVLEKEIEARGVIAEILDPTGPDPQAVQARVRIESLSRRQLALGKKAQAIADRYAEILDEMVNNRLFEPAVTAGLSAKICSPLRALAIETFPASSTRGFAFAESGGDDARSSTVETYDTIIGTVRRVLEQMERTEDIAAIVEALRIVIRTEEQAGKLVEELRDRAGADIFGTGDPGTGRDGTGNLPPEGRRDR